MNRLQIPDSVTYCHPPFFTDTDSVEHDGILVTHFFIVARPQIIDQLQSSIYQSKTIVDCYKKNEFTLEVFISPLADDAQLIPLLFCLHDRRLPRSGLSSE